MPLRSRYSGKVQSNANEASVQQRPDARFTAARPHSWHADLLANLALTLPFLLLYWADLWHHTLFFDEVNAWAISAASANLKTLFYLVHYEGHPWLWYFLLWLPSRFTHDPRAMLWVVAPFGTAVYLMLGVLSPFTRIQKALLLLGYFVAFEYTVMNRMYCVMFLLALLYVWRRCRKPEAVIGNVLLLAVMTNVDMTGVVLSGVLLLEYASSYWFAQRNDLQKRASHRYAVVALICYVVMLALSVYTALPSPDISWQSSGHIGSQALTAKRIVRSIGDVTSAPWWPISHEWPRRFWETEVKDQKLLLVMVPFILAAQWWTLRRDKNLLWMMATSLVFAILFADIVYVGRVRHWGITYVTLLVALWMRSDAQRRKSLDKDAWPWTAYALMGLSAFSGVVATASTWTHPFSQARATAQWLKQNHLAGPAMIGSPDVSFASVAEELQQPVYFMECACFDSIKLFSRHRENFSEEQLPDRMLLAAKNLNTTSLIFVWYRPMTPHDDELLAASSLEAIPLHQFQGADTFAESYYIYRIVKR